jgi:hypothetical protein
VRGQQIHFWCSLPQAATLTFFMELLPAPPPVPDPAPAGGTAGGAPFSASGCCCPQPNGSWGGGCSWETIWSYRRAKLGPGGAATAAGWQQVNVGDVVQLQSRAEHGIA